MSAPMDAPADTRGDVSRQANHGYERTKAAGYPISRWYLCPLAGWLAAFLAMLGVTANRVTLTGLLAAGLASMIVVWNTMFAPVSAILVLGYWLCDRIDGRLARRTGQASAWGAWLDANVDELVDVGLHVAMTCALAAHTTSRWPWLLLAGFLSGKYLFMYGLYLEEGTTAGAVAQQLESTRDHASSESSTVAVKTMSRLRYWYHLLANCDVRMHVLIAALATGLYAPELALIGVYYHVRWIARYWLVAQRLQGGTA